MLLSQSVLKIGNICFRFVITLDTVMFSCEGIFQYVKTFSSSLDNNNVDKYLKFCEILCSGQFFSFFSTIQLFIFYHFDRNTEKEHVRVSIERKNEHLPPSFSSSPSTTLCPPFASTPSSPSFSHPLQTLLGLFLCLVLDA